jgi:hypothetical protein
MQGEENRWCEINKDVFGIIIDKLDEKSKDNVSLTCKSWRTLFLKTEHEKWRLPKILIFRWAQFRHYFVSNFTSLYQLFLVLLFLVVVSRLFL